jgi:hypothetical protein
MEHLGEHVPAARFQIAERTVRVNQSDNDEPRQLFALAPILIANAST